ncbi:helix-turn-helix domain-containing protein [Streptomyces ginkgonis]|uniref:helix-turn-helix domain-containing protein n=1 Tax=Streptomyces ginkgonis TaxID=1812259 RepID=UPI002176B161|nr:TetR/AcrR family transcriptional regulator [Streptomyces ginkgonis]
MMRTDGESGRRAGGGRAGGLRVDAQRNLRHVLSAARDVFGEQGYGAPMEEVARRARVGVGTVYRRFPNKEALVRYIAEEQTRWLTERAAEALAVASAGEPWRGLEGFVRGSAASGSGRLLPPELWWLAPAEERGAERVPRQRSWERAGDGAGGAEGAVESGPGAEGAPGGEGPAGHPGGERRGAAELLGTVGQLVERARSAGELRADVTVADVMLVIAAAPPRLGDQERQEAAAERLLEVLLRGLRPGA